MRPERWCSGATFGVVVRAALEAGADSESSTYYDVGGAEVEQPGQRERIHVVGEWDAAGADTPHSTAARPIG
jgi:hypothetical protein